MRQWVRMSPKSCEVWPSGESPEELAKLRDRLASWIFSVEGDSPAWNKADDAERWLRAFALANVHPSKHVIGSCTLEACVLEAVSLALYEVTMFFQEVSSHNAKLRSRLQTYVAKLERLSETEGKGCWEPLKAMESLNNQKKEAFGDSQPDLVAPVLDALHLLDKAKNRLKDASNLLGEGTMIRSGQELDVSGRGRPRGSLVPTVCFYLREANVEWQDIAMRAFGANSENSKIVAKQLMDRCRAGQALPTLTGAKK
jgi:hypothetical protein